MFEYLDRNSVAEYSTKNVCNLSFQQNNSNYTQFTLYMRVQIHMQTSTVQQDPCSVWIYCFFYFLGSTRTPERTASLTGLYVIDGNDYSTDFYKHDIIPITNLPTNIDLFRNDFLVYLLTGLVCVFVLFFSIFVVTYVYFKCFQTKTHQCQTEIIDLQAQYKSLSFSADQNESLAQPEPMEPMSTSCTYLTPMFRRSDDGSTNHSIENEETFQEIPSNRQQICNEATTALYMTPENVSTHVYIEITQDNIER